MCRPRPFRWPCGTSSAAVGGLRGFLGEVHAPIPGPRMRGPTAPRRLRGTALVRRTRRVVVVATVRQHDRTVIFCDLSHTEPYVTDSSAATTPHNPWLSVAIVCIAQLMVVLDATVV